MLSNCERQMTSWTSFHLQNHRFLANPSSTGVARGRLWSRVRHLLLEQLPIPELLSYRSAILAAGAVLVAFFRSPTDAFEVAQELDRWCLTDRTALIRCVRVLQTRLNLRALLSDDSADECEQPPSKRHRVMMLPTH